MLQLLCCKILYAMILTMPFPPGPHRKGRYAPLRALTSRLGASRLLALRPSLLWETFLVRHQPGFASYAQLRQSLLHQQLLLQNSPAQTPGRLRKLLVVMKEVTKDPSQMLCHYSVYQQIFNKHSHGAGPHA